jgi:hypothetical protein
VSALILALFGIYSKKYDLVPELATLEAAKRDGREPKPARGAAGVGGLSDDKPRRASTEGA